MCRGIRILRRSPQARRHASLQGGDHSTYLRKYGEMTSSFPPGTPVWLLNAPIITAEGLFRSSTLSLPEARALVEAQGFCSAIGHAPTAELISRLLHIECPMCRRACVQLPGQQALVLRLARRLGEGQVLVSAEEVEQVGYSFMLIKWEM